MPTRKEMANAIRFLSIDAVQQAKSGHPGAPMGMADMAQVLWNEFLRHDPTRPDWPDRDRFVLSNGHASMLLYSVLHLSGYALSLDDIRNFRQLDAKTPGHPERGHAPGVETTTGPLGQGLANAVGMAMAEKILAARFNRPGFTIVNHTTYAFAGDGCLMEGISHEVCSLAGTLGLGKLIVFYDDNGISIDGNVSGWFTDDTPKRFEAYGWHVQRAVDGHDPDLIAQAVREARAVADKPSLICCKTIIGYGAPNLCNQSGCHGSPLGESEIAAVRENLGWPHPPFTIPDDIAQAWDARERGQALRQAWEESFEAYRNTFPDMAAEFTRRMAGDLPDGYASLARTCIEDAMQQASPEATRKTSQAVINTFAPLLPEMLGGSADLTGSNGTLWKDATPLTPQQWDARYIYYGVREFGMAAIMNGLALHGGFIPFGGTFLVFSDYARNGIRMAALMNLRVAFVLTHDSIGVGEDGPTHQPIEHAASLRLIPGLDVWRPADLPETVAAWESALERRDGPTALLLSRQKLPALPHERVDPKTIRRGGYVVQDCEGLPELLLIATGSETGLAVEAARRLAEQGRRVRVVSMPCVSAFEAQSLEYRQATLPPTVRARVVVEAGSSAGWQGYAGPWGRIAGLDRFGLSAPGARLFARFGFSVEAVCALAEESLAAASHD